LQNSVIQPSGNQRDAHLRGVLRHETELFKLSRLLFHLNFGLGTHFLARVRHSVNALSVVLEERSITRGGLVWSLRDTRSSNNRNLILQQQWLGRAQAPSLHNTLWRPGRRGPADASSIPWRSPLPHSHETSPAPYRTTSISEPVRSNTVLPSTSSASPCRTSSS
jgi:hypothetical protein